MSSNQKIRLAIPHKGRISVPIRELIQKAGLVLYESGERSLVVSTNDPALDIIYVRPIDIPSYVASGIADIGITGHDMVTERKADVMELLSLGFGNASIVLAVDEDSGIQNPKDLNNKRISTEFPSIAKRYIEKIGIRAEIIPVGGACEATPHLGISDAIIDITSSGTTLKQNRLTVIDTVLETQTMLIANHSLFQEKKLKIDEITLAFESVINARNKTYLMMNVWKDHLEDVLAIIPGMAGPTIMQVASGADMVAVHAVVDLERVYQLINRLKNAGARDILVMAIERMVP
ncbi:MAG: ATP phosphoribosyltransferase [Methanospirillaceae archaeon]|nr:ATP phosphoribosyltransferase [Methanospirillaceae archaeon]